MEHVTQPLDYNEAFLSAAEDEGGDEIFLQSPRFRNFKHECDAACLQFERAQEWADLIHYLQRLQRILTKYSQLPIIPDKVLVAKRLYQCLNPALPSGVHKTTLETIELIFSRIGPHRLARDLAFYSEGIFPLYRHASYQAHWCCANCYRSTVSNVAVSSLVCAYCCPTGATDACATKLLAPPCQAPLLSHPQVKPALLELFERYYVPLGHRAIPCLPGLVLALLTAMEDVVSGPSASKLCCNLLVYFTVPPSSPLAP